MSWYSTYRLCFIQYSPLIHNLPCRHIQQGLALIFSFHIYLLTYLIIYLLTIRNAFHIKKSASTSFLTSFLICHFIYVTYTFGCKDNKKQGKKYTLPILFSHLGLNLRIIITIIYFVLNASTENKPYTYIRTQKTPRSSQTREQELINQIHYSITFCFSPKAHHMKNNA